MQQLAQMTSRTAVRLKRSAGVVPAIQCVRVNTVAQMVCCPHSAFRLSGVLTVASVVDQLCEGVVRTFPSCTNPSWTLCTFDYFGPQFFCCLPGEQCFIAVGDAPACGPGDIQLKSTQMLSTVSPLYTRGSAVGPSVSAGPSVSPQSSLSSPSLSSSYSSSALVLDSKSQVAPSITRTSGSGIETAGASSTSVAAGGAQTTDSDGNPASDSSSKSSGLGSGVIAGIVVGSIFGLALIAFVGVIGARYGSRKAIENYTAAATANVATAPPVYIAPESAPVFKQEPGAHQAHEVGGYYNPAPHEHAELGSDGRGQ